MKRTRLLISLLIAICCLFSAAYAEELAPFETASPAPTAEPEIVPLPGLTPEPTIVPDPDIGHYASDALNEVDIWAYEGGELEVHGQATLNVPPDTVTIRVGASIEGETEKNAIDSANGIITDILDSLRALGIEERQIKTTQYSITRKESTGGLIKRDDVYVARISLDITLTDFLLINQVVDTAVAMGANEIGNLRYTHSQEGALYRDALTAAIEAARTKAESMATAAGVETFTLLSLRELSSGGSYVVNASYESESASRTEKEMEAQIMGGEIEISANVSMTYRIK